MLKNLLIENAAHFRDVPADKMALELAKLNINRQVLDLLDTSIIGNKIKDKELELKGLILDRTLQEFIEFDADLSNKL